MLTPATLDDQIHRIAANVCEHFDPAAVAAYAAGLQALLAYRAAYHRPASALPGAMASRFPAVSSPLPAWATVGRKTDHCDKRGEIVAREEKPARVVVRYPDGDVVMPAAELAWLLPLDGEGRVDVGAMAAL